MFFGLKDPFGLIRSEVESSLRQEVADTELEVIKTFDEPKFLTLGRKTDDGERMIVTHFGFAVRAQLYVRYAGGSQHEVIDAALTFLFANVDRPGAQKVRTFFDLHADAAERFTDETFRERFLAFKMESADSG
jgi:hypothetical protein